MVAGPAGGCLLIDPAVTVAELAAAGGGLARLGLVVGWATHPHWDHVLWSRELGDAPRYAAPAAVTYRRDGAPGHGRDAGDLRARSRPLAVRAAEAAGRPGHRLGRRGGAAHRPRRARAGSRRRVPPGHRRPGRRRHVLGRRDTAAGHRGGGRVRRLQDRAGPAGGAIRRAPGGAGSRARRGRREFRRRLGRTPATSTPGRREAVR